MLSYINSVISSFLWRFCLMFLKERSWVFYLGTHGFYVESAHKNYTAFETKVFENLYYEIG